DKSLAYARHYPAINWTLSYSEYLGDLTDWYRANAGEDFAACRGGIAGTLQEENKLMEIVKLVGADVLPDDQKLVIETAKAIRVGFLQQNAYHKDDTYVPIEKQLKMMRIILHLHKSAAQLIAAAVPISRIIETGLFERVTRVKYDVPNDRLELLDGYAGEIDERLRGLV
ncbi:MAG: V-type ATP synthase subunit A, partial [Oscillospiraceae bacterium]|nr:V-type ATP synthase subunit A [Oscillospiraceae bacterium]